MNIEPAQGKHERIWLIGFFSFMLILTAIACYFLWVFAAAQQGALAKVYGTIPNPALTEFFFERRILFLLLPAPWLLFALYATFRGAAPLRHLVAFSSTLLATLIALFIVAFIAFALPWFPRYYIIGNEGMRLNPEHLAQALIAAERNDSQANYRLYQHYSFTTRQRDLADQYLKRAATLGHSQAQTYLRLQEESTK